MSGGQSQRIAIGRAIVKEPKAFLFDEPLSNLDAELRVKMRGELIALHQRLGVTMIYVTHDQVEAMTMADSIVVLRDGRVEQVGSPVELYTLPANQFVAGFLGAPQMNFIPIKEVDGAAVVLADGTRIGRAAAVKPIPHVLGIRPEDIAVGDGGAMRLRVAQTEILGAETIVHGHIGTDIPLTVALRGISQIAPGTEVPLTFDPQRAHLFDKTGIALR